MAEEWSRQIASAGGEDDALGAMIKAKTEHELKVSPANLEALQDKVNKLHEEKAFRQSEQVKSRVKISMKNRESVY
jgi:hypothetical protein